MYALPSRFPRPRTTRAALGMVASLLCVSATLWAANTYASAAVVTPHVWGAEKFGLTLRSTPDTTKAPVGNLANGTLVKIVCTATGATETGPQNIPTPGWDRLNNMKTGPFAADAFINTGQMAPLASVPACPGYSKWNWPLAPGKPVTNPMTNPATMPVANPVTNPVTKPVTVPLSNPVTKPVTPPQATGPVAILAAMNSQPGTSTSYYESRVDGTTLFNQGCTAANHGEHGVAILDFGNANASGAYAVSAGNAPFSFAQMTLGAEQWAKGYVDAKCNSRGNKIVMALGVNNYRGDSINGNSATMAAALAHGTQWGQMVTAINALLVKDHTNSQVLAAGAGDFEIEWGPAPLSTAWVDNFVKSGNAFFNFGTANGCPANGGTCISNDDNAATGTWTTADVLHISGGAAHTYAVPEMYGPGSPQDWAHVASFGASKGTTVKFAAVMVGPTGQSWDAPTAIGNLSTATHTPSLSTKLSSTAIGNVCGVAVGCLN